MAERRMISKKITDTDAFLDMPLSTQALYFHFIQNADDDGFVGNPNSIIRKIGANKNDYDLLIAKRYVILFETGICVIKHWRIHNYIQNDRYIPTTYINEKSLLKIEENKSYSENVSKMYPQYSIDKDSIDKDSIDIIASSESSLSPSTPPQNSQTFIELNLIGNETYDVEESYINEMQSLYANVDVKNELKKMRAWLINNPTKRKTRKGICRFINNWLAREQDKGGNYNPTKIINVQDKSFYE